MKARGRTRSSDFFWEPAPVLPAQLLYASDRAKCGELRLVAALFEDALRCMVRNVDIRNGPRSRDFAEAHAWFRDERRDWPFAFSNVCEFLALDASEVRGYVERLVSRHVRKPGA